jgi:hypothetical protein
MTDQPQPTTAEGAQTRLAELTANSEWGAKLTAGDAAARTEFDNLSLLAAGVSGAAASTGFEQPVSPTVEQLIEQQKAAEAQREVGLLDAYFNSVGIPSTDQAADVRDYASGKISVTPELRAQVEAKVESFKRDKEFIKRVFDGDREATRLLSIASAILCAPVKEASA